MSGWPRALVESSYLAGEDIPAADLESAEIPAQGVAPGVGESSKPQYATREGLEVRPVAPGVGESSLSFEADVVPQTVAPGVGESSDARDSSVAPGVGESSESSVVPRRVVDRHGLAKKQRRLARTKKGSRLFRQRSRVLANAHSRQRISNRNECHRITTTIVQEYGHIGVEALAIKNMVRSAKGTVEEPGRNVAAKSGLNREIQTQTWGVIRTQLKYKAAWAGRRFVEVDPRHTSQTCSICGVVDAVSRQGKDFSCQTCGFRLDADVNAARNILRKSLAGGNSPPPSRETVEMCRI